MIDYLDQPGEHHFTVPGPAGIIECKLSIPKSTNTSGYFACLGHPHPLYEGTMDNKVVTTMVRACVSLDIPTLRFNFRGVGQSEGAHDRGIGEAEDMLFLLDLIEKASSIRPVFAGFSFGSYVAYRAAAVHDHALLISIAPPVHHNDYHAFPPPRPWHIIQGDADDVVPSDQVITFAESLNPSLPIRLFEDTGHFFHGKLPPLKSTLIDIMQAELDL